MRSGATLEQRQREMRERYGVFTPEPAQQPSFSERHFAPAEIAQTWRLSVDAVRRLFRDEPGVLKIGESGRRDGRRDYVTLRIPESVVRRVHAQRTA